MPLRTTSLNRLHDGSFDVLIVGGGINGAVSAAVLAGRGASVALIDRGDFGAFTSQESSNLVWGGFKYLESYEFFLVRKLCVSRNRLIRAYPDNIKPIPFMAALDHSSPFPPRQHRLLGHRQLQDAQPAPAERGEDQEGRACSQHRAGSRRYRVLRRLST